MDYTRITPQSMRLRNGERLTWMMAEDVIEDGVVLEREAVDGRLNGTPISDEQLEQLLDG